MFLMYPKVDTLPGGVARRHDARASKSVWSRDSAMHQRTRETCGPERLQSDLTDHGVRAGVDRIKRIRKARATLQAETEIQGDYDELPGVKKEKEGKKVRSRYMVLLYSLLSRYVKFDSARP